MLAAVTLAAVALPLLLAVLAVGLRLARAAAGRIDAALAAPVVELPAPAALPGPLQLVGEPEPSTRTCPECAEAVLSSASVCRHCHARFAAPLTQTAG